MFNLKDRRIIITGASHGLGCVCAKMFSEAGARLVLMARSAEQLEAVKGACINPEKHLAVVCDLTDFGALPAHVAGAVSFLGQVDAVLHCAGGGLGLREALLDAASFLKLFSLNVLAASELNRLIAPEMVKNGHGNLVHVGSIAGNEVVGSVGYSTTKACLAAYVRTLGKELAPSGVVVTGITPGGFIAPENSWTRLEKNNPEAVQKFIAERLPRKRLAQAEEIVPLLGLLCSEQASMMSGCLVPIDAAEGKAFW